MIAAKVGGMSQHFVSTLPDGYVEMNTERPSGNFWIADASGDWVQCDEMIANAAQEEMIRELVWADIELAKHEDNHKRKGKPVKSLRDYKNACRDYVRNNNGTLVIDGEKPTRP